MRIAHPHRSSFVMTALLLVGALVTTVAPPASAQVEDTVRVATGVLVDVQGRPVTGVTVTTCLSVVDRAELGQCRADVSAHDGRFSIPVVDADAVSVIVLTRSAEVLEQRLAPTRFHTLVLDDPTTHQITLHEMMRATGRLVGPDGPLVGASVTHRPPYGETYPPFTAVTDQDGRFEIDAYPRAGRWCDVHVAAADHQGYYIAEPCSWGERIDFGTRTLRLDRTVEITATRPDGGVLLGFTVYATDPQGHTDRESTLYGRPPDRVNFNIGTGDGTTVTMLLVPDEPRFYALPVRVTSSATNKHQTLTIPTLEYATLRARVTTPDGDPVDGLLFSLERFDGAQWAANGSIVAVDGTLHYAQLQPGRYRLTPSSQDALPETPREFTVSDAREIDLGNVTARPLALGYRAKLTITAPTVSPNYAYSDRRFPVVKATVSGLLPSYPYGPGGTLWVDLLNSTGTVVSTQRVYGRDLEAELPSDQAGTQSGYSFRIRGNGFYDEVRSAVAPPHTISRHGSRLGTPKFTHRTIPWDERTEVTVPLTGIYRGKFELLIDGVFWGQTNVGNLDSRNESVTFLVTKLPIGKHKIQVRRPVSGSDEGATSASSTLTVTRAKLERRPTVTAARFTRGTRPTIRVSIPRTRARTHVTGKLKIYVGKRAVTTIQLTKRSPQVVKVRLPHRAKSSIKVRAVYVGNSKFVGATSKTVTVKPRR